MWAWEVSKKQSDNHPRAIGIFYFIQDTVAAMLDIIAYKIARLY